MYLNLIFSKVLVGEYEDYHINHYDTTTEYKVRKLSLDELKTDNYKILPYKLRSNSTIDKWIEFFTKSETKLLSLYRYKSWAYNYYSNPSWETIKSARIKLNKIVDDINNEGSLVIPEELKVSETDSTSIENDKLNDLHFIFEKNIFDIEEYPDRYELFYLLEGVNNLVHLCEKYKPGTSHEFHSYRLRDDMLDHREEMLNQDYENMDTEIYGTAMLDFGTVGKDLAACYYTNDIELVKKQEIKQQDYIKPFIAFDWTPAEHNRDYEYSNYYSWCENNNVKDYGYNYKEPKYNLGRVVLGDLVNKHTFTPSDIQSILLEFPYFADILLTDNLIQ